MTVRGTAAPPVVGARRGRAAALLALALALALAALAGCEASGGGGARSGGGDSLRVALLTSGPVSDAGWYAGAYEGLLLVGDSTGARVSHQQTRTPSEFDEAFLAYGDAGFDLVFAHGFEYQDAAIRAGERFPDLTVVVSGGGRASANVVPLVFTLEQATYLAGMAAAGVTRSGVLGMVGGVEIPPVQGTFRSFEAGARAVDPGVEVLETFIGTWDDVAAAREATVAQLRRGADVIVHNTDAASFGVFQAVREAARAGDGGGPWIIGMNRDQNDVAPEVTLGSAVIRISRAFLEVARRWRAGTLDGPVFAGLEEDVVDWVPNPAAGEALPAALRARVDAARDSIRAGTLVVPRVVFVEGEPGG